MYQIGPGKLFIWRDGEWHEVGKATNYEIVPTWDLFSYRIYLEWLTTRLGETD